MRQLFQNTKRLGCNAFCNGAILVSNKVVLSNTPGATQVISLAAYEVASQTFEDEVTE